MLAQSLTALGEATEAEVAETAPVASAGLDPWMQHYAALCRLHGRASAIGAVRRTDAEARAAVLDALAEVPGPVALRTPPPDAPQPFLVYPKSPIALFELGLCERRLQHLRATVHVLRSSDDHTHQQILPDTEAAIAYFYALAVWILGHPGPGLPYDVEAVDPQPPAWAYGIDILDVPAILAQHFQINFTRLKALEQLTLPPDSKGEPLSWAGWFAAEASERATDAVRLLRGQSLGGLLAQRAMANDSQRRAMASSKHG